MCFVLSVAPSAHRQHIFVSATINLRYRFHYTDLQLDPPTLAYKKCAIKAVRLCHYRKDCRCDDKVR